MNYQSTQNKKHTLRWVDIGSPETKDKQALIDEFGYEDLDVDDLIKSTLRSRVVLRKDYILMVLMVPVYDFTNGGIDIEEVDFVIRKNELVTVHNGDVEAIARLFRNAKDNEDRAEELLKDGVSGLLIHILGMMLHSTYDMIDAINGELKKVKKSIFTSGAERQSVERILAIRRDITQIRQAMRSYASIMEHMLEPVTHPIVKVLHKEEEMFDSLIDEATELWESLESEKELIEALEDANETLVAHRLNRIMKTLTAFSVILLPAGVMASIFGMNLGTIPFAIHPQGFTIVLLIMGGISALLFAYFSLKHWLK